MADIRCHNCNEPWDTAEPMLFHKEAQHGT
jgi:hypothetical protein